MAKSTLTADRRAFLSAAGIMAAATTLPAMAAINPRSAWESAMSRWRVASAASDRHLAAIVEPAEGQYYGWAAMRGVVEPDYATPRDLARYFDQVKHIDNPNPHQARFNAAHDEYEHLLTVETDLHSQLLQMPAPNLAALRWKLAELRLISSDSVVEIRDIDVLLSDVTRLMGDA